MTTLREAAQQVLEAIDWLRLHLQRDHQCLHMDPAQSGIPAWINRSETNLRAALAEPVQEPVAWVDQRIHGWPDCFVMEADPPHTTPLYAAPPQRKPLTDEEILKLMNYRYVNQTVNDPDVAWIAEAAKKEVIESARAIERAHGIGGNNESA